MKKIVTILFSLFCLAGFAQINVGTNFNITAQKAIDTRMVVNDTTARNAISPLQRYNGMFTYVISDSTLYQLVNGITNSHWKEFSSGATGLFTTRGTNVTPIDSTKGIMLRDINQVPVNRFLSNGILGNSSSIVTNTPWGQKTNLFTNPSFESYTNDMLYFNNYESMTFGNSTDRTYDTSSNAYHGNFSLFLDTAYDNPTRPQQTINVSPSTNYVVSVYGYGIGIEDSITIDIRDDDSDMVWDFSDSTWKQSDSILYYKNFLMPNGSWGRIECPYVTTMPYQSSFHVDFGMKENTRAGFIDAIQVDTGVAAQAFAENGIWHNASFERFFMYKPFGFENTTPSTSYFNYFESSTNWSAGEDAADGVRSLQINIDPYGSPLIFTHTITGLFSNTATFSYKAKANTNDTSYVAYLLIDGNTIFDMGNTRCWNFLTRQFEAFDLRYGISSIAPYITVDTCYDSWQRHYYTFSSPSDYLQQFTVMMFFGNFPPLIPIIGGDTISIDSWQIEAGRDTTKFNNIYCRNAFANPMFQYTDDTTYWQIFVPGDEDTNSLSSLQYVNDALSPTGTAMLLTTDDSASSIGLTQGIELGENYNFNISFYARGRQNHDTLMFAIINGDSLNSSNQYMWNFITEVWDLTPGGPGVGNIVTYALDTTYQRFENNFIPRGNQNNYYPIMITGDIGMGNKSQAGDSIYFQGFQLEAGDTCTDVFYNDRYNYNIGHAVLLNSDTGTRLGSEWYKENGDGSIIFTNSLSPRDASFLINRDFGVQISARVKSDEDVLKIENNNESLLKFEIGDTKHELNIENTDLAFRDSTSDARLSLDNGSFEVTVDTFRINNYALPLTSGSGYYYMSGGQTTLIAGPGGSQWNINGLDIYNNNVGNVGIGTISPYSKLHVVGDASMTGDVNILNNSNIEKVTVHYAPTTETGYPFELVTMGAKNTDADKIGCYFFFSSANGGTKTVAGNGYEGGAAGFVAGNGSNANTSGDGGAGGTIWIYPGTGGTGAGIGTTGADGNVILGYNSVTSLPVGNVGIATNNPLAKLHVNGYFMLPYGAKVNYIDSTSHPTMEDKGSDSALATTPYVHGLVQFMGDYILDTAMPAKVDTSAFNSLVIRYEADSIAKNDTAYILRTLINSKTDTNRFVELEDRFVNDSIAKNDSLSSIHTLLNEKVSKSDSIVMFVTPTQLNQMINDSLDVLRAKEYLGTAIRSLSGGDLIVTDTATIYIEGNGGDVIITSVPSITNTGAGVLNNYVFKVVGTSDAKKVTLQSESQLPNSGLLLNGTLNITLGANDVLMLMKLQHTNKFIEISRSIN